jgi:hypothetical protein
MTANKIAKTLLRKGIFVQLNYFDSKNIKRFVFLMQGEWLNFLNLQDPVKDECLYDISLNQIFDIDSVNIDTMNYHIFPKLFTYDDILDDSKTDNQSLKCDKDYIDELKVTIHDTKISYKKVIEHYLYDIDNIDNLTQEEFDNLIYDHYILRYYPKKIKKTKNLYDKIIKDINDKFFIYDIPYNEETPESNISAFKLLGISDKNLNVIDDEFLNALKRKWFKLIDMEKNKFTEDLLKVDLSFLDNDEKEEYTKELKILESEISLISNKEIEKLQTVKDIISYWPSVLEPKPYFVYND